MIQEIKMPSAGQTTDEAKIVAINVKIGDTVKRGDVLVEAETDKAVLPLFSGGQIMISYISRSTDPAWNLALEEYFFETVPAGESFFMLWQNHNTVVIGKNQNTLAEIDRDFVRSHGITVVRRLSGGGAVYHDDGNINFTFITDAPEGNQIDLRRFCLPVAEALRSFGVNAQISGRNDITVDGKKFSGNAQYLREGRVMHHGTILFNSDSSVIVGALQVDREKLASKGVKSVSSRVTNLIEYLPAGTTIEDFKARLLEELGKSEHMETMELDERALARIEEIKKERYDTWEWNYGRSPGYTDHRRRRIEGVGLVEISMEVKSETIRELQFFGDFFENSDVSALAELLKGCRCKREDLLAQLEAHDPGAFIRGLTAETLAELIAP